MKGLKKFFNGLITFILVGIIIGGIGYLGYNFLKGSNIGMNLANVSMPGMNMKSSTDNSSKDQKDTSVKDQGTNSSTKDTMNMSKDSMNTQNQQSNSSEINVNQVNQVLMNKENLDKVITTINDSLKLMTLDPYSVEIKKDTNNGNAQQGTDQTQKNGQSPNNQTTQGNTTVNVYTAGNNGTNSTMNNMGITYDQTKMEKLHSGLYKVSIGVQLLNQLKDNMTNQVDIASGDSKNLSQYYYNQYYLTVQNKNKLNEVINYISEAGNLLNINPYASNNGAIYDKDRMSQIHESVYKLAQGSIALNKLNDELTKQVISLGNLTQNYSNMSQANSNSSMNMNNPISSIFSNLNFGTIANMLLIIFISAFIIGMVGLIFSQVKALSKKE